MFKQENVCLKVPKSQGEKAIVLANKLKIFDKNLKVQSDEKFVYVPLLQTPSKEELETFKSKGLTFQVLTQVFPRRWKHPSSLIELLEGKLPPHLLASLPKSVDFVGDIAIIEVPPELKPYNSLMGEAILKLHKNVKTVLAKAGAVSGTFRLRKFEVIAGKPKTSTIHKEYGCIYHIDLAKAYFSPRLSYEHYRVASSVREGETVLDLFAGVGPFSILIAKLHRDVKVYAVDLNPYAVELLKKNVRVNRVNGKVYPILGDAKTVVRERLSGIADRVIMNLPERALNFIDAACKALKPSGGIIHFYSFVNTSNTFEKVKNKFFRAVKESGRNVDKVLFSRFVRATAPHEWQIVLDVKVL
ncbi:class I SAM-dependent methyltransferase family protein [Candidatus Bathyarchaeota archaeon]|nr:MAG: class I SAM-dependent methyltransferase family protein [Candidatus Bathyarchaeota archaeon]